MLTELKREASEANLLLPKLGLINLTSGYASALDRAQGIFAIKPSGVDYAELKASDIVLVDLEGKKVEGKLNPSSDTPLTADSTSPSRPSAASSTRTARTRPPSPRPDGPCLF